VDVEPGVADLWKALVTYLLRAGATVGEAEVQIDVADFCRNPDFEVRPSMP
jgi:hypothetical protein